MTGADQRADVIVGERHDLLGSPIGIVGKSVRERRDRGARFPAVGDEGLVLEVTD